MNTNPFKRPVQDPVLLGVGLVDYSIAELQAIQEQVQARLTRLEQQFVATPARPQPVVADPVRDQVLVAIAKHRHQGIRRSRLHSESWAYRRLDDDGRAKLVQQLLDDGEVVRIDPVPTSKAGRQPVAVLVAKAYAGKAKEKRGL